MADILTDDVPGFKYSYIGPAPVEKAGVTVRAPTDAEMAAINKPKVDIGNIQPALKERIDALAELWKNNKELNPKGEDLPITSGYRTLEQQREEYKNRLKNPNLVAEPGKSRHEKGNAFDLHPRVPNSLLEQVGLHRPHGAKDPVHVEINPDLPFESKPYDVEADTEAPGFKFKYTPKPFTAAEDLGMTFDQMKKMPSNLAKTFASAGDVALGTIPAAAQFVAEPFAKLIDRVGNTKVAEEALNKVTNYFDKPIGKTFGITNDPVYNAEATRKIMDYAAEHVDKGADWIAENTGMDKSDAKWFVNAALLKAAPTVAKTAKATGRAIGENVTAENAGNLLAEISGKMTNTSPYNTKRAFAAGYEKNPAILEASKEGAVSAPEIVGNVREAFQNVKESRSQAYKQGIASTKNNQVFLDFSPIRKAFNETVESLKSKNLGEEELKVGEETMATVDKIGKILDRWEKKPELHTAGNLDDLKQRIDDTYSQGMTDQAKRVMTSTRNAVKDTIVKQDKNYEKTMADYEKGLELEREIQKALSLGDKVGVDTTIRKLAQVFSNKSTLSKEYRLQLLQELERVGGKDIINKLAGYAMSQKMPGALQLLADVSVGVGAHMFSPEMGAATLLSTMASQSPKLALYGSYAAGRAARAASDVKQAAKTKLSEITSRK
jgi:ribosomal protein S17E